IDWPLTADLAYRAHRAVEQATGRTLPVAVTLRKRIPAGAGLGGGSADAAGMIVALDRLFDLDLSPPTRQQLAAALGSDVVFALEALHGQASCLVAGVGDTLTPLPQEKPLHVALALPNFGCATGPVYRAFDALPADRRAAWSPG